MLTAWADADPRPRAVVDLHSRLFWQNAACRALLDERAELCERSGLLVAAEPAQDDALLAFVAAAGADVTTWCMPRPDDDGHILFRAQRIGPETKFPAIGLIFHRCGPDFVTAWADIRAAFKLTRAESEVVHLLLDGNVADKVAERLGIGVETVRSHVRAAYSKLAVSSREEMFARLYPYRIR